MWRSRKIKMVSSHTWLAHPGEKLFHAYLSGKNGTHSVCEGGAPISSLGKMDLPGDRSLCCLLCFSELYAVDVGADLDVARMVGVKS